MRIKVLIPNSGMDRKTLNARETMLSRAVSTETEISVDCIQSGPVSIESVTDEVFAGPLLLQEAIRAEREGYDAFVVYCFSDLAITALRENVDIPVIGPGECALAAADILSNKFCVITTVEGFEDIPKINAKPDHTKKTEFCPGTEYTGRRTTGRSGCNLCLFEKGLCRSSC